MDITSIFLAASLREEKTIEGDKLQQMHLKA